MPTKTRGMTSLEIAIIVAIVLIIAVAVGWYLYTTFVASTTGQPRLNVVSAELSSKDGTLKLYLVNPGPVDVEISRVEVSGQTSQLSCTAKKGTVDGSKISVGAEAECTASVPGTWTPGTMIPGRVILSGGQSFPFNAVVKP
ncbi:class III signal peptide [Pyrobaculum sp.]|uniref:class III signal peptide n=1 Tax=Pyrobaculum sp. TaxID=2004705 RepID=UPI003166CEEB